MDQRSDADTSFDAFLSYHSGDSEWVATLKRALDAKGIRVWLDTERLRPGDAFPGALARAVGAVRCVVIVLSPGSAASEWVGEEYSLALTHRRHVIPVLIEDAEPPGFLAGRSWVDFRDPAQFDASLDQLLFGITGLRAGGEAAGPPPFRDAPADRRADESAVLERLIKRRRGDARQLWIARGLSAGAGLAIGVAFCVVASAASVETRFGVCLLATVIVALAGWGATATGLTRLTRKVEQFEVLRDGLEACRARSHPGCTRLRQHFWDMMLRNAADAGLDVSRA